MIGDGGIISRAELSQKMYENGITDDEERVNTLTAEVENRLLQIENEESTEEIIENTTSYCSTSAEVYYADVDGDGTVDGIIFADLAIGGSGTWEASSSYSYDYSYDAVDSSSLKEYTISEDTYTDDYFGEGYIITPASGTTGEDRFYVMALEDETANSDSTATNTDTFCWWAGAMGTTTTTTSMSSSYSATNIKYIEGTNYKNLIQLSTAIDNSALDSSGGLLKSTIGIDEYDTLTSTDFGSGYSNTMNMKAAWEAETYGTQNASSDADDIWSLNNVGANVGNIGSVWFVPSYYEWITFAGTLGLTYDKEAGAASYGGEEYAIQKLVVNKNTYQRA